MEQMTSKASRGLAFTFGLVLACAPAALAQDATMGQQQGTPTAMTRSVAVGEKGKVEGTIVTRNPDSIIVRDERGQEQPKDKERAQRVSRVDKGGDPPGQKT